VFAGSGWPPASEGRFQQLESFDFVRLHENPVGKGAAAGAGNLVSTIGLLGAWCREVSGRFLVVVLGPDPAGRTRCARNSHFVYVAGDVIACIRRISTNVHIDARGAGGGWKQQVELTGLQSGTVYYYRVLCAVQQPAGTFTTAP
jgi:hypothetical protein